MMKHVWLLDEYPGRFETVLLRFFKELVVTHLFLLLIFKCYDSGVNISLPIERISKHNMR